MKVFIASDLRATVENGHIYLESQHYYIIKRYFEAFGKCILCCRVKKKAIDNKMMDATDYIDRLIEVKSLKYSLSPHFIKIIDSAVDACDLIVGRFHSIIAIRTMKYAQAKGKKCFAELMGDAWDGYWNHGLIGKLIAPWAFIETKSVVKNSDYALYVTSMSDTKVRNI